MNNLGEHALTRVCDRHAARELNTFLPSGDLMEGHVLDEAWLDSEMLTYSIEKKARRLQMLPFGCIKIL